jgi:ubiquinone/menaquinone biosynthesis C-methylase UbiE
MNIKSRLYRKTIEAFDTWADSYESDVTGMIGRRGYDYRKLAQAISSHLHRRTNAVILEIGTGTGLLGKEVAMQSDAIIFGVDISDRMISRAHELGVYETTTRANAERLPFQDGAFDSVYSTFVLHSVLNPKRAMQSIYRVLKHGGSAVVVDLCPVNRSLLCAVVMGFVHSMHREFGAPALYVPVERYVRLALETGFTITTVKAIGTRKRYSHFLIALRKEDKYDSAGFGIPEVHLDDEP